MKENLIEVVQEDNLIQAPKNVVIQQYETLKEIKSREILKKSKILISNLNSIKKYIQYDLTDVDLDVAKEVLDNFEQTMSQMSVPENLKPKVSLKATGEYLRGTIINPDLIESYNKRGRKKQEELVVDINKLNSEDLYSALKKNPNEQVWGCIVAIPWSNVRKMAKRGKWPEKDLDNLKNMYILATAAWTCMACKEVKLDELLECRGNCHTMSYSIPLGFFFHQDDGNFCMW